MASRQEAAARPWQLAWLAVLLAGTAMQIGFWLRAVWIYLDQVALYELGMSLARDGVWLPFGKLSTGGLPIPGVVLQFLVGLPLVAWTDLRASTLVLLLAHLAAVLILTRVLMHDFSWRFATLYLLVFWLSPWRLFHSGFLWETNYLVLPAALHLAACRALRQQPRFGASALLAATLLLTAQIHASFVILALASLTLLIRHRLRLHWGGVGLGTVLGLVPLLPTVTSLLAGNGIPGGGEPVASLITRLNSVEKALVYWFRLGSLDVGRRFRQSLYCIEPGGGDTVPHPWLCHLLELNQVLALASVLLAVAAGIWLFRPSPGRRNLERLVPVASWYRDYTLAMLLAVLFAAFLSPVLIQGWHVLVALPIACLPVTVWIDQRWPTAGSTLRAIMLVFLLWHVPASLLLLGHPMYARPTSPELPRHIVPADLRVLLPDDDFEPHRQ